MGEKKEKGKLNPDELFTARQLKVPEVYALVS